jgi:hypothetical protein
MATVRCTPTHGVAAGVPAEADEAVPVAGVGEHGGGEARRAVVTGADRRLAAAAVRQRCGDERVARDDLPVVVRAVTRRPASRAHPRAPDPPGDAPPRGQRLRTARQPRAQTTISDGRRRVADRAVPGHWEGDWCSGGACPRSRPWPTPGSRRGTCTATRTQAPSQCPGRHGPRPRRPALIVSSCTRFPRPTGSRCPAGRPIARRDRSYR